MISLKLLKRQLRVDEDQIADDQLIMQMEEAAVAFIENETGRYFGQAAQLVDVLSANGFASIWLRGVAHAPTEERPVLVERRTAAGAWEEVASTDYEIDGQRLYPLVYWTPASRSHRATYWAGYVEGEEPADIRQAVREIVTKMYQHRTPIITGTVASELPLGVRDIIRANRVVVV